MESMREYWAREAEMMRDKSGVLGTNMGDSKSDDLEQTPIYYEATRGDTVFSICAKYKISQADFKKWNGIDSRNTIKLGAKYIVGYKGDTSKPTTKTQIRQVTVTITSKKVGTTIINTYPDKSKLFRVPLYEVIVTGTDSDNKPQTKIFNVVRYGVGYKYNGRYIEPGYTGYFNYYKFTVKEWLGDYLVGHKDEVPAGAFKVNETFYLHTGSEDITSYTVGSIGCVLFQGKGVWVDFVTTVKRFANASSETQLAESHKMTVIYEQDSYPPLNEIK